MAWNLVSNNGSVSSELDEDNTRYDFTLDAYGDFSDPVVYTRPYNSPSNELLESYTPEPGISPHHNFSHTQLSSFLKEKLEQEEPVKEVIEEPVIEEPVIEEPVKEEPAKEEQVKEEPAKEEQVKEEPVKEEPVKEENDKTEMPIIFLTINVFHESPKHLFSRNCIFMFLFGMFIKDIFRSYYLF